MLLRVGKLTLDIVVLLGMLVSEREVFEFGLDFVKSQTVGKRSIDVESLPRDFILFVGRLRL